MTSFMGHSGHQPWDNGWKMLNLNVIACKAQPHHRGEFGWYTAVRRGLAPLALLNGTNQPVTTCTRRSSSLSDVPSMRRSTLAPAHRSARHPVGEMSVSSVTSRPSSNSYTMVLETKMTRPDVSPPKCSTSRCVPISYARSCFAAPVVSRKRIDPTVNLLRDVFPAIVRRNISRDAREGFRQLLRASPDPNNIVPRVYELLAQSVPRSPQPTIPTLKRSVTV